MKREKIKEVSKSTEDLISEYRTIMNYGNSTDMVIVETEWKKSGDYIQKFSMYDDSYRPVKSLGSTTLISTF